MAIATNCNPGSSYATSLALCIALAVRGMEMIVRAAVSAATIGGTRALRCAAVAHLARADAVVPEAPSREHRSYRAGMPRIIATLEAGSGPSLEGDVGADRRWG